MAEDFEDIYEISDEKWAVLEPLLPGQRGQWGGIAKDNRLFINAVLWILRTGVPWQDLPESYGKWGSVHKRFRRWCKNGTWDKVLDQLMSEPEYEWLMIGTNHCKVHPMQQVQKTAI